MKIQNSVKNLFAACLPATFGNLKIFSDWINYVLCIIGNSIIPFIFSLAVVVFVWGVVQYIMGAEEEAKRAKGREFMIWGIVALTVMMCVWGLVKIVGNTFGVNYVVPQVQDKTLP